VMPSRCCLGQCRARLAWRRASDGFCHRLGLAARHGVQLGTHPGFLPMNEREEAQVVVEGAYLRYGTLDVLANLSLHVGRSEIVSIVGPSGCGKTTLLRCVSGLDQLDGGKIRIDGQLVEKPSPSVSMVFQHFGLFPWRNLWNNIAYGLKLRRTPKREVERRVAEAIDLVGLKGFEKS